MVDNINNLINPQDLAEAKQAGLRNKIENERLDINNLPQLPQGAVDAIQEAGMNLKMEVTDLLDELKNLNSKDPRYVDIKKEVTDKKGVMQSWKQAFNSFQVAKQEFYKNLFSYSKANDPMSIAQLADYFSENHMGFKISDKVGILANDGSFVTLNEIISMGNKLMLPANKERNLLMQQAFEIEDSIARKGIQSINMRQIDHKLYLQRTDTADGEGGVDPDIPKEYALSSMYDDPEWIGWAEENQIDTPMIANIVRVGSGTEFRDIVAPVLVRYDKEVKIQPSIDAGVQRYELISTPVEQIGEQSVEQPTQ